MKMGAYHRELKVSSPIGSNMSVQWDPAGCQKDRGEFKAHMKRSPKCDDSDNVFHSFTQSVLVKGL